jgi:hypothetical protein
MNKLMIAVPSATEAGFGIFNAHDSVREGMTP